MARQAGAAFGVALVVVWLVIALGLVLIIGMERLAMDDQSCPVPGVESLDGDAAWQWWPPGQTCSINGTTFSEPPAYRGWLIVGEVVLGVVGLVVLRRRGDTPDPDWTA